MRVALIEDHESLARGIENALRDQGYAVDWLADGLAGAQFLKSAGADVAIIDINLPGMNGLDLVREIRARGDSLPILILTAQGKTSDRVKGLDAGADDYLVKPFEPKELLLRINAILRRMPQVKAASQAPKVLQMGAVRYDIDRGELWRGADPVKLTATEAQLMRAFAAQPGQPISREKLAGDAGPDDGAGQERAVDVQITRLRRKIEDDPKMPRYLQTVRGEGYMLQPD